ncbi:MAG: extensin family protein [Sphingobium phenoxybenzoativorans]
MRASRVIQIVSAKRRSIAALAILSLLAGCSVGPKSGRRPGTTPHISAAQAEETRQCMGRLASTGIMFERLPDKSYGGGCSAIGAVKLTDIGVPTSNLGAMTCGLAANFSAWARYGVTPAARLILGSELVKVETFGTYNCRPIAGSSKLSEHASSNAVDVAAFTLADGRRIDIRAGWNSNDERVREFLRVVRTSACKRFRTVLSPDYNAAHHDHLHFDMGGKGGYCR